MIEILQSILEVMIEVLLISVLAVFGFSWDKPEEDTVDTPMEAEIVRLQVKPFDRLTLPIGPFQQTSVVSDCNDTNLLLPETPALEKSEISAFIT